MVVNKTKKISMTRLKVYSIMTYRYIKKRLIKVEFVDYHSELHMYNKICSLFGVKIIIFFLGLIPK